MYKLPINTAKAIRIKSELEGDCPITRPGDFVAKLISSEGNYLFKAKKPDGENITVSLAERFRNAVYVSRGKFVICTPLDDQSKKSEIIFLLSDHHIKGLVEQNLWPDAFIEEIPLKLRNCHTCNDDEIYPPFTYSDEYDSNESSGQEI